MITKDETRRIFDRSKIGVGDIIEFYEYGATPFRKKPLYSNFAIVSAVSDSHIWVHARRKDEDRLVEDFKISVKSADEIRMLMRHPLNEKDGE